MSKNVAVFVDVANIFYAAKAAGVDIDYVTLLKSVTAGRDLVRAYAYTGLDPDNENQRNFHDFLRRHGYKVVSKDIRKYGDGKVKANLDIELVVDMMKTARKLDVAVVISGDGDFAPAIRAVQETGVRVEVVSFRGNTSSDLIEVADLFTEIVQIAKVEKGSSRSGRRVADDEADLSMTEVPDKMSEGTGRGRSTGRGRGRGRAGEAERAPAAARTPAAGRTRRVAAAPAEEIGAAPRPTGSLVALPGERLSRAASGGAAPAEVIDEDEEFESIEAPAVDDAGTGETTETGPRRRRRRGGRGRGRGRDRAETAEDGSEGSPQGSPEGSGEDHEPEEDEEAELGEAPVTVAPARRSQAFGSVWDSQLGQPQRRVDTESTPFDEEDLEEPQIPEYLITERRQRNDNRGGGRGGARGSYASAIDRERYGAGRSSSGMTRSPSGGGSSSGGMTRRPEPPARGGRGGGYREDRPVRSAAAPAPRPTSDEPWSEVPPELEEMIRAQLASKQAARPAAPPPKAPVAEAQAAPKAPARRTKATVEAPAEATAEAPKRRTRARAAETEAPVAEAQAAPKAPARRTKATVEAPAEATAEAPKRRTRAKAAETEAPVAEAQAAPKARARRTKAADEA